MGGRNWEGAGAGKEGAIDILHLIDRLEELAGEARRLPIGGGIVVDRRRLLDLIDQIRVAVPQEVRESQDVLNERQEVLARAREEAERVLAGAQADIEERLEERGLLKEAEEKSRELVRQAEDRASALIKEAEERAEAKLGEAESQARGQMDEADRYALEMLRKLQAQLASFEASVRAGVETLEKRLTES